MHCLSRENELSTLSGDNRNPADGFPRLWLQFILGRLCVICLLCKRDPFPSPWAGLCRGQPHFPMVFYPSLGSCKFVLKVSILRDVIITWKLSLKTRQSLKVASCFLAALTFWQTEPPLLRNSRQWERKQPSLTSPLSVEGLCKNQVSSVLGPPRGQSSWPELFNRACGNFASLVFLSTQDAFMQLGRKLFPPCRGTAISCLSGSHYFLYTGAAPPLLPAHWRLW